MSSAQFEFEYIRGLVRRSHPQTSYDVRTVVDEYFNTVIFSVLKDEWSVHMDEKQRHAMCEKLLLEGGTYD